MPSILFAEYMITFNSLLLQCLWSLFYNVKDTSAPVASTVDSVHVCSGPDAGLDFDRAVEQVSRQTVLLNTYLLSINQK